MPRAVARPLPVARRILVIRQHRVLLDRDLAELNGVEVRALNQAVKRNAKRFPQDFVFRLVDGDVAALKSQLVISKPSGRGGARRARPKTERHAKAERAPIGFQST